MEWTKVRQISETRLEGHYRDHYREIEDCGAYWVCMDCETRLYSAEDYCLCKGFRREDNGSIPTTEE